MVDIEILDRWGEQTLIEAMKIWTGKDHDSFPSRHNKRIEKQYGIKKANKLIPILEYLDNEFYKSDANIASISLVEMGEKSEKQFKEKHPNIPNEISQILSWCYTYVE